jgi:transposase-like protein
MKAPETLREAVIYFANPANCLKYMADSRWPDGVSCPTCGRDDVSFLANQNRWQCKSAHPKRQFTAKVGTIFEDSPLGLEKWLPAVWLIVNARNGISSYELARALGVTQKTAWFMLHRIREAMKSGSLMKMGGSDNGPVEVDETFVGGRYSNMHRSLIRKRFKGVASQAHNQNKAVVMGMRDRETRQIRAKVIPNVKRETLQNEILENVEKKSTVYTDAAIGYYSLAERDFIHETVNHLEEYVRGEVHTNGIENFWSLLKRSLKGTYVAVEPYHLDRYVSEQVFRFNNRSTKDNPLTDSDRFALAISQVADKRLTYAEVTGKVGETSF